MGTARGKIGRLPVDTRRTINKMIRDNCTAEAIIAHIRDTTGEDDVSPQNVSNWKTNGYQDWLRRQERLEDMAARRAFARELVESAGKEGDDSLSLASNAAAALAVDAITSVLEDFDPSALKELLADRPDKITALVQSLARLRSGDQEMVRLEMAYREHKRQIRELAADAARKANSTGNGDLADLAAEMNRILGV